MTRSGERFRESLKGMSTEAIPDKIEDARAFVEEKGKTVADKVRGFVGKAKESLEAGQRAYHEVGQNCQTKFKGIESKSNEIASMAHRTIDALSKTVVTFEHSLMDPIYEVVCLARGVERGIRNFIGLKPGKENSESVPAPFYEDERLVR